MAKTATYKVHIQHPDEYPFLQQDSNLRLQKVGAVTYGLDCTTTGIGRYMFHSFSSLSYDRSKAFSEASSPHSAI